MLNYFRRSHLTSLQFNIFTELEINLDVTVRNREEKKVFLMNFQRY